MKKSLTIKEKFSLAFYNHKKNNLKVAASLYNEILKINSNHFEANYLLGSLLLQTKRFDKAQQLFEKALKINSNHGDTYNNLGITFGELKKPDKAIDCFEKAIKILPENANAFNNIGNEYKNLGKIKEAINSYQKAIEIEPDNIKTYNNLGLAFVAAGERKVNLIEEPIVDAKQIHEFKNAINCFKKIIEIKPHDSQAYNNLGVVFNTIGEIHKSKNYYEKALELQPSLAEAHSNLGMILKELGELDRARICFEKAVKYKTENFTYLYYLSALNDKILNLDLKNMIIKIIKKNKSTKKSIAYANYLLSRYERKEKNYENELNYLIKGHSYYFESKKKNSIMK